MRRLFSIVLIALLSLNLLGGYVYFFVRSLQIKKEMRALIRSLPDERLAHLVLTMEDFTKARVDEHEVKVDGKMYDIARIRIADDNVHVYGVHDQSEDSLLSFLDTALNRLQSDAAQPPGSLVHFSILQYIPADFEFAISGTEPENIGNFFYRLSYRSVERSIDSPPPKA